MIRAINNNEVNRVTDDVNSIIMGIDLDAYTDGDIEFEQELISLIISNVKELQWSLGQTVEVIGKKAHKIKSSLIIINSDDINELIFELSHDHLTLEERQALSCELRKRCDDIIAYLNTKYQKS